jgi:hypothetical protein
MRGGLADLWGFLPQRQADDPGSGRAEVERNVGTPERRTSSPTSSIVTILFILSAFILTILSSCQRPSRTSCYPVSLSSRTSCYPVSVHPVHRVILSAFIPYILLSCQLSSRTSCYPVSFHPVHRVILSAFIPYILLSCQSFVPLFRQLPSLKPCYPVGSRLAAPE